MGRKALPDGDRRDRIVRVRIMNRTYGKLEVAARHSGHKSVAEYVRSLIRKDVNDRKEELGLLEQAQSERQERVREVRAVRYDFPS